MLIGTGATVHELYTFHACLLPEMFIKLLSNIYL